MRPKDGETLMCQTCANIVRQNHFEKLGNHHFVSLIDKRAPDGEVDSKDFYKSVINKAWFSLDMAQDTVRQSHFSRLEKPHYRKLTRKFKIHVVSATTTELERGKLGRCKGKTVPQLEITLYSSLQ